MKSIRDLPHKGQYVAWVKRIRTAFKEGFHRAQITWGDYQTAAEFERGYMLALNRRINNRAGIQFSGRKMGNDYQTNLRRDQRALQDKLQRRIRVYQFSTPDVRKRFGHLLDSNTEF